MDEDRARYLDIEQIVKRELRDAERVYVNGILQNSLESEAEISNSQFQSVFTPHSGKKDISPVAGYSMPQN